MDKKITHKKKRSTKNTILTIDPSGTGTTGIFIYQLDSYKFQEFKSKKWQEHLQFLVQLIKEHRPGVVVYENTTYIYGRQHQGTVGLYKLIGGLVALQYTFPFLEQIASVAVNQVKPFKNRLLRGDEQLEGLTFQEGRGKGWMFGRQRISLHQLDALIVYHLWSGGRLTSKLSIQQQIANLKAKKRLGTRQQVQLQKLQSLQKILTNFQFSK